MRSQDKTNYRRLLSYVAPQRRALRLLVLGTVVYGLTEPLVPMILQPLIDGGFLQQGLGTLYQMTLLLCLGYLIRGLANFTADYHMAKLAQNVVLELRRQMFAKLLRLPLSYFQEHREGSLISKFTYDVLQLMAAATDALAILVRETVTIIALLATLLYFDWRLTLLIFAVAPLLIFFIVLVSRRLRAVAHRLQGEMGDINQSINEALRGKAIIRIHNGQAFEEQRFNQKIDNICQQQLQAARLTAAISPLVELVIIMTLSAIMVIAGHWAQQSGSELTIGRLISFIGAMALLFPPIKRLSKVSEPIQRGLAAMHSVFSFLDEATEKDQEGLPFLIKNGEIRLENICVRRQNRQILDHINLHIRAGETIALVGESGSGKSTLAGVIAGFVSPDSGHIYFDHMDADKIALANRRAAIGYVPQETVLFSGNVAENIAYGRTDIFTATGEIRPAALPLLDRVAEECYALNFIKLLPRGYLEDIGDNGSNLSGGQRQRLALGRAFYRQAPILILDEATSALDNQSEQMVSQAIENIQRDKTTIIIAHRLATIRKAHRIVVLSEGRIIEEGSHAELLAANGYYSRLLQENN